MSIVSYVEFTTYKKTERSNFLYPKKIGGQQHDPQNDPQ